MKTKRILFLLGISLLMVALGVWEVSNKASSNPNQIEAQSETVDFSMEVVETNCSTKQGAATKCNVPVGSIFTAYVNLNSFEGLPDADGNGTAGYLGFDIQVNYSEGLTFKSLTIRGVWPDCWIEAARTDIPGKVLAACIVNSTSSYPNVDFLESTYLGPIMRADFTCGTEPGTETITLAHGEGATDIINEFNYTIFDSDPDEVLTINCVELTTPTPTEMLIPTATPTPTLVPGCDMGITKTDSEDPVNTGAVFSYSLVVQNHGDVSCNRVTLRDRLPREVSDIIAFGIPCALRFQEITCHLFSISPGESAQLEIIVTAPTEPGTLTNQAWITTTTRDVNLANNSASETTVVEAPAFPAEDRDIVFIQGIDSASSCFDENNNGLSDGFVERVEWMKNYLTSQEWVKERVKLRQFLYFSYGLYCFEDFNTPLYTALDTCDGIQQAAEELRTFIATRATAKVTIIAHSMGGLVAAYMIATEDEDWVNSHIASVITFDSPLEGLPPLNLGGLDLISVCNLDDETRNQSLLDLSDSSDVVTTVVNSSTEITEIVPFYTMDAVELGLVVEVVPGESTTLDGVKIHKTIRGVSHTAIWELRFVGRREERLVKQIVGCSIILADSWAECQLVSKS